MGSGFQKQQDELRRARQQMTNLIVKGEVTALDRFNNPIEVGAFVVAHMSPDPVLKLVEIVPPLKPTDRPDTMTLVFEARIPIQVRAGLPISNILVVKRPDVQEQPAATGDPDAPAPETADPEAEERPEQSDGSIVLTD